MLSGATAAGASGGIVPPNKGLRGVLDNIVSDGMRMAAEVRKRMDEAQRELERNALDSSGDSNAQRPLDRTNASGGADDDDDDDYDDDDHMIPMLGGISSWGAGAYVGDDNMRNRRRRERDHDLLDGAEAQSMLNVSISGSSEAGEASNSEGNVENSENKVIVQHRDRDRHQPTPTSITPINSPGKGGSKVEFES